MFYTKRKTYRGRWLVKLLQAGLVLGLIFFGLDALGQWLNPVADNRLELPNPEVNSQELTVRPILEEARNNSEIQLDAEDYFSLALEHQDSYEYYEAVQDYTRSLELDSSLAASYLNRGVAYEQLGEENRALADFNEYMNRDGIVNVAMANVDESDNFTISMYEGYRYDFPISLAVGDVVNVEVRSVEDDLVDPLILLVNANGEAVAGNDDVLRQDGTYISMNSYIQSFEASSNETYTLYVSHAGGGSYGDITVKISIDN